MTATQDSGEKLAPNGIWWLWSEVYRGLEVQIGPAAVVDRLDEPEVQGARLVMRPRLLDLFCGAGGAAVGYHRAGFDVVGVDINPQPNYPFRFYEADALAYLAGLEPHWYDVIHASPPCQLWADGTPDRTKHVDLISPLRPMLIDVGLPYVIENVRAAPLRDRVMICGGGLALTHGEYQLHRHRYFESNVTLWGVPCARQRKLTMSVVGHGTPSGMRRSDRPDPTVADRRAIMGIDWMHGDRHGLAEAIPPAYTQFIGEQLLAHVRSACSVSVTGDKA